MPGGQLGGRRSREARRRPPAGLPALDNREIVIAALTVGCVALSCFFAGPRDWLRSLGKRPFTSFLILLSVLAVFLGSPRETRSILDSPVDTVRTLRILVLSTMAAAAFLALLAARKRSGASGSLGWLAAYALFAMVSASYSMYPLLTLYKGYEVVTFVVLGLYVGTRLHAWRDVEDIVNVMLFVQWYLVVSALIGLVCARSAAFPAALPGEEPMAFALHGVFPSINPNSLTQLAATLASCSLCWLLRPAKGGKTGVAAVLLLCLTCMGFAHSRTSIFAFLVCVAAILMAFRKRGLALFGVVLAGGVAAVSALSQFLVAYLMRGQTARSFSSLSGRTNFWPQVTRRFWESPVAGHGYYASQRYFFGTSGVDNCYLEVLLGLGIIGLTMFCLAVQGVLCNLYRSRPPVPCNKEITAHRLVWTELAVIFFFLFIRSLTGPSFQGLHVNLTFFVLVTVCAAAARRLKKADQLRQQSP